VEFESIEENATYREEIDEQTGFAEKVIVESRDKKKNPTIKIMDPKGKEELKSYSLPVGAHIIVEDGKKIEAGDVLVKIPRSSGKGGDITGGLPRVTELFEARNPSNPAVVSEIDGIISYGKIKRGNREIIVESRTGEKKYYLVPLSKHILVQENDFIKAGAPLSDGSIAPGDILDIQGPTRVQEYLVDEVQEVYRMQGVKINDKHFEVIVRQMMRKVEIEDPGDTRFLERQSVNKIEFMGENDAIYDKLVVTEAGDSAGLKEGQIVTMRKLRDENSALKRKDAKPVEARPAKPATARTMLQGITRASLQTESFISAASFQETTKVLNEAAVNAKEDHLLGLKENVIVGHLIPAGTGARSYQTTIVANKDEYARLQAENVAEEVND
jgi:DNA-directed RNA polymerase subunit beta'